MWSKSLFVAIIISLLLSLTGGNDEEGGAGATVRYMPFFFVFCTCLLRHNFWNRMRKRYVFATLSLCVITFAAHADMSAKDLFVYLFGIICTMYISERHLTPPQFIYKYFIIIVLPLSVLNIARGLPVSWVPDSNMAINILGYGTKHGTATVGFLLFIASLCNIYLKRHIGIRWKRFRKDLFFFGLSFYLVFFSTSRSIFMCMGGVMLLLLINWKNFRPRTTITVATLLIVAVYLLENLSAYADVLAENEIIGQFLHTENFGREYGVTSGRSWLWAYHLAVFFSNLPFGGGREVVDFRVGDWIGTLGEEAHAGSESFYTGILACYGLIGVILILLHISLFLRAIKVKNVIGACIIFASIYATVTGEGLVSLYDDRSIMLFLLYFSSFQLTALYKQYGKSLY